MQCFDSVNALHDEIKKHGYIINKKDVYSIWFAYKLKKAILLDGPPGTGKTEIAKVISNIITGKDPIRLQMYEGIDSSQAIYDWDYKKQLLYIQSTRENNSWQNIESDIYSRDFILVRPLLKSIVSENQEVLLIDEIDKSDEEFEAMLLEFLAEWQITIQEKETIKAVTKPLCFITTNNKRELSDALLRRCITIFINYPTYEQELEIINMKVPQLDSFLAQQIVYFINLLRVEPLKKIPSISESIDWAITLVQLGVDHLDEPTIKNTLNVLLKFRKDIEHIEDNIEELIKLIPKNKKSNNNKKIEINEIENVDWNF